MNKFTNDFIRKMIVREQKTGFHYTDWMTQLSKEPFHVIKNILRECDSHRFGLCKAKNNFDKSLMLNILEKKILYYQNGVSSWITENHHKYLDVTRLIKQCYRDNAF